MLQDSNLKKKISGKISALGFREAALETDTPDPSFCVIDMPHDRCRVDFWHTEHAAELEMAFKRYRFNSTQTEDTSVRVVVPKVRFDTFSEAIDGVYPTRQR